MPIEYSKTGLENSSYPSPSSQNLRTEERICLDDGLEDERRYRGRAVLYDLRAARYVLPGCLLRVCQSRSPAHTVPTLPTGLTRCCGHIDSTGMFGQSPERSIAQLVLVRLGDLVHRYVAAM